MFDKKSPNRNSPTQTVCLSPWAQIVGEYSDPWSNIVASNKQNPTHLPGWVDITIQAHQLPDPVDVLAITEDGSLRAAVPIFYTERRQFGLRFKSIELVTNVVSYHADLATLNDRHSVWQELLKIPRPWDIFRAANLATDSPSIESIKTYASKSGLNTIVIPTEESPYIPIDSDWETFIASKNKKFRYKIRQRQKILNSDSHISATRIESPPGVEQAMLDILQIESRSWKAKFGLDIQTRDKERSYYSKLLPFLAKLGALHIDMLYYDETPIAYSLCVNWNGWFGQLKTSFDERYTNLSPGSIVIDKSIQAAFDVAATEFDFLGDTDKHKRAWTDQIRSHADVFVFNRKVLSNTLFMLRKIKARVSPQIRNASTKPTNSV